MQDRLPPLRTGPNRCDASNCCSADSPPSHPSALKE